jgi:hypothetical protein
MARNLFESPADFPVVVEDKLTPVWGSWVTRVHNAVSSLYQSGTTADRPTSLLWLGRVYFDTTLGYPVWVQSVRPTVWVDAAGTPV